VASREDAQAVLARVLLEKVHQDDYPSATQMDMIEQTMPPAMVDQYLGVLLEKVIKDPAPSITMLRRIQRVSEAL
jgi:hypothetical protein